MNQPANQTDAKPEQGQKAKRSLRDWRSWWRPFWRIGLGTLIIIAGIVMLVFPGPGIVTIIAGLALMADEFPPAKRLLQWMRKRYENVRDHAKEARTASKARKADRDGK